MKCTLDGANARIMAKAIQSLSKFGNDLFIEADRNGMQLRSLNSTKSALGTFIFKRTFFETFHVKNDDENFCKVSMKVCLQIFKNMKQVEHCELRIKSETLKFQILLKCRLDTTKDLTLAIVDEENIAPAVSPDDTSNKIAGSYKIFNEISSNFNATEEEITLEATKDQLIAKNYVEGAMVAEKFMRSQLKLKPGEFDKYDIETETTVTFCLKEFRAFLMFAESINEQLFLHFEEAGSPVFLRIKRHDHLECLLIMSTLSPDDISFHEEYREREVSEVHNQTATTRAAQKRKTKETLGDTINKPKKRISEETTLSNDGSSLFQFIGENGTTHSTICSKSAEVPRNIDQIMEDELNNDEHEDILMAAMSTIEDPENITLNATKKTQSDDLSITFYDTEEAVTEKAVVGNGESIPQSPARDPERQIRKIFSRCFLSTYVPKEPSPSSQIYVPDSDTED